jgi:hypothetical protein
VPPYTQVVKQRLVVVIGVVLAVVALPAAVPAEQGTQPARVEPRGSAVSLQDLPPVRIDDADGVSHSRVSDSKKTRRPEIGAYTFLSSTPGSYRRVTRITSRLSYIEQLERSQRYVTFQGGLRVALGK